MIKLIDGVSTDGSDSSVDGGTGEGGTGEDGSDADGTSPHPDSTGHEQGLVLGAGSFSPSSRRGGAGLQFGQPAVEIPGAPWPYPNLDLTCYAGALGQSISALIRVDTDAAAVCAIFPCRHDGTEGSPTCIQCAFKKVMTDHRFKRSTFTASLKSLYDLQSTSAFNFPTGVENDPSEYLYRCLLNDVSFSLDNPIIGSSHIEKTCRKCGYRSCVASECFSYLILAVARSASIEDVIAATLVPETVPAVHCPRCRELTEVSNLKVYDTLPRYLVIFVTQYRHVPGTRSQIEKTKEIVSASERLDLSTFGFAGRGLYGELISSIIHTQQPNHYTAAVKASDGRIFFADDGKNATLLQFGDISTMPVYGRIYIVSRGACIEYALFENNSSFPL